MLVIERRRRPKVIPACTSDLGLLPGGTGLSVPLYGFGVVALADEPCVAGAISEAVI